MKRRDFLKMTMGVAAAAGLTKVSAVESLSNVTPPASTGNRFLTPEEVTKEAYPIRITGFLHEGDIITIGNSDIQYIVTEVTESEACIKPLRGGVINNEHIDYN